MLGRLVSNDCITQSSFRTHQVLQITDEVVVTGRVMVQGQSVMVRVVA